MTDGQVLLLAFIALYLSECCYWLPLRAAVFPSGNRPRAPLATERSGLVWLPLLPPAGRAFACQPWPFSVTPDGVCSQTVAAAELPFRPDHPGLHLDWDAGPEPAAIATDGKKILVGGRLLARCASGAEAHELARFLAALASAPPHDRHTLIRGQLDLALSVAEADRRMAACLRYGRWARRGGAAVFVWCLLVLPPAYLTLGLSLPFLILLGLLPVLMWLTVAAEFRAHRHLFPPLRSDRWSHAIVAALAPQHTARAGDLLAREALGATHPAALAPAPQLAAIWRDANHPLPGSDDPVASAFHGQFLVPALRDAIAARGLDPAALDAAAPAGDGIAYCPRCHERFDSESARCEACGGLTVRRSALPS